MNKKINSGFDFYELGVGADRDTKAITLFGDWKVNEKLGLLFEMPCMELKLSKPILDGQGEVFLRALRSQKEVSLAAGLGFKW